QLRRLSLSSSSLSLFIDPATSAIYTLSLHDALPIFGQQVQRGGTPTSSGRGDQHQDPVSSQEFGKVVPVLGGAGRHVEALADRGQRGVRDLRDRKKTLVEDVLPDLLIDTQDVRSEEHTSELQSRENIVCRLMLEK